MWDHNHDFPITVHCKHCRSEDVTRDAVARWNTETQRWELSHVFDNVDCDDCSGGASLVERKMDGTPVTKYDTFYKETNQ
jgi:hypothetical protein